MKNSGEEEKEKAALLNLYPPGSEEAAERDMEELFLLSRTAGVEIVAQYQQKRFYPDPAYYIGRGKLEEIKNDAQEWGFETIIFNQELSPVQTRNLENFLERKVLDRTALILDIFAKRARSKEGKLQVELAQLQYHLTQLTGHGTSLSRLGGGIGTRGPGEPKLEINRRHLRQRISELKKMISSVRKHRRVHRQKRKKEGYPMVSLVGYTNTGKSSLLNALAGENLLTEDMLFATLDPTVRKIYLESGEPVLLADTVGFIRELPSQLLNAFKATLEEINEADLILHLVDISNPDFYQQIDTVEKILNEILEITPKKLLVFNKIDRLPSEDVNLQKLPRDYPGSVFISVHQNIGLEELMHSIYQYLSQRNYTAFFAVPYQHMDFVDKLYRQANVKEISYHEGEIKITAETDEVFLKQHPEFLVETHQGNS